MLLTNKPIQQEYQREQENKKRKTLVARWQTVNGQLVCRWSLE
jgi:hypothetical protein